MPLKIKVIIGSTRQGRFCDKPANWIFEEAKKKDGVEAELLDLRDFPMPYFDDPVSPAMSGGKYTNEVVKKWAAKIGDGDAFIIVTPEYNHGAPAVLKNALDVIYPEWNKKPVAFVSYGGVGGARVVEQLRQTVIELQLVPIRNTIHIPSEVYMAVMKEPVPADPELFAPLKNGRVDRVAGLLDELIWYGKLLKTGRDTTA